MLRALLLSLILCACGGGGGSTTSAPPPPPPPAVSGAQIDLLFMGNSHTAANALPQMVAAMVRAASGRTVDAVEAPEWMFLNERARHEPSLALLRSRAWRYVVLQAQEYSSSGQFDYPIDGAVALVRLSRAQGAVPIMFPEWPRRGIAETQRIYDLHLSIARAAPACVPPIPQSWDLASARHPDIVLWNADGNHSAPAGAFLAALILATTMTGTPPDRLPALPGLGVDDATQARLRAVAAETVLVYPPHTGCPGESYLP